MHDRLPGFGSHDREQILMAWAFATILLWIASLATSLIATICFVVLLIKQDASRQILWKGFIAIALAWTSLVAAEMIVY
jgi:hypothetical protein